MVGRDLDGGLKASAVFRSTLNCTAETEKGGLYQVKQTLPGSSKYTNRRKI